MVVQLDVVLAGVYVTRSFRDNWRDIISFYHGDRCGFWNIASSSNLLEWFLLFGRYNLRISLDILAHHKKISLTRPCRSIIYAVTLVCMLASLHFGTQASPRKLRLNLGNIQIQNRAHIICSTQNVIVEISNY